MAIITLSGVLKAPKSSETLTVVTLTEPTRRFAFYSCRKSVSLIKDGGFDHRMLGFQCDSKPCKSLCTGALDEDVVVIESTPAPAPPVPASEEINVTSTDSEVEIVTVGEGFRWAARGFSHSACVT